MELRKEIPDQLAHAGYLLVTLIPVVLWPHPVTGAWAGFGCGFLREITEEGEVTWSAIKKAAWGLDISCWSIAGVVLGSIGWCWQG
jgi:hypothetical protein